jgi:prepilin peptidase CpaA
MPTLIILIASTSAAVCDLRWRRIPNWLVVATMLLSLIWHTAVGGLSGLWMSAAGLFVGIAVLLPLFLLRGMGAGDVKFFGALSAAVTYKYVFTVLLISAIIAGIMALFTVLWGRVFIATLRNLADLLGWLLRGHFKPHPVVSLANKSALALPFGVSMAAAAWLFILFGKP